MTPKISLVTAVVGSALAFAAPAAWGQAQPDAFERAVPAHERSGTSGITIYRDAFERAVAARERSVSPSVMAYRDAFERAVVAKQVELGAVSTYPDVFERAVVARTTTGHIGDHSDRIEPVTSTAPVLATSSGREIQWAQIAIGFGVGVLLALGLFLAMRLTRIRSLAH